VAKFLLDDHEAQSYLEELLTFLRFALPYYLREGRAYLTIALGCTGGRHRSVSAAEFLAQQLQGDGREVGVRHRDIDKE